MHTVAVAFTPEDVEAVLFWVWFLDTEGARKLNHLTPTMHALGNKDLPSLPVLCGKEP